MELTITRMWDFSHAVCKYAKWSFGMVCSFAITFARGLILHNSHSLRGSAAVAQCSGFRQSAAGSNDRLLSSYRHEHYD